jgi:hypothetical protein
LQDAEIKLVIIRLDGSLIFVVAVSIGHDCGKVYALEATIALLTRCLLPTGAREFFWIEWHDG